MTAKPVFFAFALLLVQAAPVFPQASQAPAGGQDGSVLEVKPGPPAVRASELTRNPVDPWKRFPLYILHDQKAIWTSPFHTARSDAKWWAIFGAATAGLIAVDSRIANALPNSSSQVAVATWTSRIGAAYTLIPLDGVFYLIGVKTKDDRLRETGFIGAEALVDAVLVQIAFKAATRRERPLEGSGKGRFWSSNVQGGAGSSFPSGHAMETMLFASVISHEYPRPLIVPIAAYGLAVTVAGSRMAARRHFASDVVAGAAIGWFLGDFVFAKRHNPQVERRPSTLGRVLEHVHFGGGTN